MGLRGGLLPFANGSEAFISKLESISLSCLYLSIFVELIRSNSPRCLRLVKLPSFSAEFVASSMELLMLSCQAHFYLETSAAPAKLGDSTRT